MAFYAISEYLGWKINLNILISYGPISYDPPTEDLFVAFSFLQKRYLRERERELKLVGL